MTARGNWLAQHAKLRQQGEAQKARLADLVAEGYSVAAAARAIGITQQRGSQLWKRIRDDLGEQAE